MRSACSAIEVAAAGERGTAEVKLAGASRIKGATAFGAAVVRKNPAEVAVRKCNEFNARSPAKCCML